MKGGNEKGKEEGRDGGRERERGELREVDREQFSLSYLILARSAPEYNIFLHCAQSNIL